MKGFIFFGLMIAFSIIGWSYCSIASKRWAIKVVKKNLMAFVVAAAAVGAAVFFSLNSIVRLV